MKEFDISCRTLEYACVNYARKHNVAYSWVVDGEKMLINIADEYRRWLDQWNRPNFDFFRRYARIYFESAGQIYETTVGQIHMFYWADKYGIIEYVRIHMKEISTCMSNTHGNNRIKKQMLRKTGMARRRQKMITGEPMSHCFIYELHCRNPPF